MHATVAEILNTAYQARKEYIEKSKLEAYRLYDREDWLPWAIDIYGEDAIIHLFDFLEPDVMSQAENDLKQLLKVKGVFFKNRTKEKFELPKTETKTTVVEEYGHKFFINLSDYLDMGLFLDHRETRRWLEPQCKGKIVLNTFCYTGSFSIYAAAGGAEKTYSVDLSRTYGEWFKKNLELNNLPQEKNWFYKMDTLEFFRYAKRKNLMFDIIIIDPPTFSRNKGESFSVQKDHPALINGALDVLNPGGFIIFSNNKVDFELEYDKLTQCKVKDFHKESMPPDFTQPEIHQCYIISK